MDIPQSANMALFSATIRPAWRWRSRAPRTTRRPARRAATRGTDANQMETNWAEHTGITESERWKMRLTRLFLVVCMASAAACADVSDGSGAFDGDETADS